MNDEYHFFTNNNKYQRRNTSNVYHSFPNKQANNYYSEVFKETENNILSVQNNMLLFYAKH